MFLKRVIIGGVMAVVGLFLELRFSGVYREVRHHDLLVLLGDVMLFYGVSYALQGLWAYNNTPFGIQGRRVVGLIAPPLGTLIPIVDLILFIPARANNRTNFTVLLRILEKFGCVSED